MHGLIFALAAALIDRFGNTGDLMGEIYFFAIALPALLLATPFSPLLWSFHLMTTPGWFAWPTLAGFVLVYLGWFCALLAASRLARVSG